MRRHLLALVAVAIAAAAWIATDAPRPAFASTGTRKSVVIGNMDELECFKELKKLKIPHVKADGAPKIEMPIILTGPILGVHFDTGRPYQERTIATADAIDCRLAVSLHH